MSCANMTPAEQLQAAAAGFEQLAGAVRQAGMSMAQISAPMRNARDNMRRRREAERARWRR